MESDCIFCKIINGDIPLFRVYEDNKYIAFLDISHFTEGHTLVIPKKHVTFIWDVENIGEYMEVVKKIGNHYRDIGYKYVDVMLFGRDVPHVHVHVIPHNGDDADYNNALVEIGKMQSDPARRLDKETGLNIAQKFKL